MGITQFDIIRQQAEAAAKNAVSRASASLRRDTSLVNRASRLTGKAIREGEAAVCAGVILLFRLGIFAW